MHRFEDLQIDVEHELEIAAPITTVFEQMIRQLSSEMTADDDSPLPMELERRPGGRWFRDLGDGRGHLWGFVQSIREPDLLELSGPMFMSYPVSNHIIIRFEESPGSKTRLHFHHRAFGLVEEDHRTGVQGGWRQMLERVDRRASAG